MPNLSLAPKGAQIVPGMKLEKLKLSYFGMTIAQAVTDASALGGTVFVIGRVRIPVPVPTGTPVSNYTYAYRIVYAFPSSELYTDPSNRDVYGFIPAWLNTRPVQAEGKPGVSLQDVLFVQTADATLTEADVLAGLSPTMAD